MWPWGLVALRWRAVEALELAAAAEAAARPNVARELTVLARASYAWGR